MEKALKNILEGSLKIPDARFSLTKLHGDASNRIYHRLRLETGRTFIVMQLPAGMASVSEEITNLEGRPKELPFLNINRFLKTCGLPVPEIYHYDKAEALILLEDLGDWTLEKHLHGCSDHEEGVWYQKAIDLLIEFQRKGTEHGCPDACIAFQRSFDETLLRWEFDHFLEYGIEARLDEKIDAEDRKKIDQGFHFIIFALQKMPTTLVHRDFQSRNLMIHEDTLKIIDYQDALIGPLPYDLVALLRDSYIHLPWERVSDLADYYCRSYVNRTGHRLDRALFKKMFDWMTIQRKSKDAGRFVYIDKVKGNPSFLPFIPNSLSYVREAFERQEELGGLFEVLKKYVPEFN